MSVEQPTDIVFSFGPFEADLQTQELTRQGIRLRLPGQSFQILAVLLQRPGQLISREELQQTLWPGNSLVDSEKGLNAAINRLREALGDSAENPRYVETLPRRGYRFIASVTAGGPAKAPSVADCTSATAPTAIASAPAVERRGTFFSRYWMAAALVSLIALIVLGWAARRQARLTQNALQSRSSSIEVVPLVALHGSQGSPAFSPDGNLVAFGEYGGADGAIYTALIGGDKPLRLTVKSGLVCCPAWSPDSRQIAFTRFLKEGFSINLISALGGAEKTLYTAKSGVRGMCARLAWSPDGKSLAFSEPGADQSLNPRIAVISLDDLSVRRLTSPAVQDYDCEPAFSPDGSRLAFERGSVGGLAKDLFVVPVNGGDARRLTFDNSWGGTPAWTQDGTEIVFSSKRGGPLNLWRISATGGLPRPIAGVSAIAYAPSISRQGNLLAYEHATLSSGIWRISLKDGRHSSGHPTRVVGARGMINYRPSFSPDGKKVVFESDRLGFSDIWYCDSDGSNCTQLTSLHGTAGTARWSPDGRRIAFECQLQHYYDIYVLELPDGRPRRLVTFPEGDNGAPNWSRDGKWIYFYSGHEKGPLQLWKLPFQGGSPVRVTRNGGVYATESEDGRFLYFSKMEQSGIWRMPLNGGEEERVLDQPEGFHWFDWVLASGGIYFVNDADAENVRIEFFDFATGKRNLIDNLEKEGFGLTLAPDGRSLLYSRTESEDYEIMLVRNFH